MRNKKKGGPKFPTQSPSPLVEAPWSSGERQGLSLSHGPWTWVQFPGSP
jgi:hypothetical protein